MTKRIILCADDFGLDRAISLGALELLAAERLSAVSCLTDAPLWSEFGARLSRLQTAAQIGLHFNLTHPFGFDEQPLGFTMARALFQALDRRRVAIALDRQLERFTAVMGRAPDFIDGHQHVHAFPGIRDIVHARATAMRPRHAVLLRNVRDGFGPTDAPFKRRVIRGLARAGHLPAPAYDMNTAFAGDYSLRAEADYPALFEAWLAAAPDGGLIMCHPAANEPWVDVARAREFQFLESPRCDELLTRHGTILLGRNPDRSNGQSASAEQAAADRFISVAPSNEHASPARMRGACGASWHGTGDRK